MARKSRKSMELIYKDSIEQNKITEKTRAKATEVEKNIDEVYKTLESLPGALDAEIVDQIKCARMAAKAEADKDGTALETAQQNTNRIFNALIEMAQEKVTENEKAVKKLEDIRSSYGRLEISKAISIIGKNTEQGENAIQISEDAKLAAEKDLKSMRKTIGG